MLPLLLGCLLEKLSHITYSGQLVAMSNHIIADLILFSVSLASMAGLLVDAFLHQRLLELPVYGVLLLLDVSLSLWKRNWRLAKVGEPVDYHPNSTLMAARGTETRDGMQIFDWSLTDRTSHMRGAYQDAVELWHNGADLDKFITLFHMQLKTDHSHLHGSYLPTVAIKVTLLLSLPALR